MEIFSNELGLTRSLRHRFVRTTVFSTRVLVVLSLLAAFEIAVPDSNRSVSPTLAAAIPQTGLLLAVDAADTTSYSGSGTTWTDLSGNGKHGTLTSPSLNASTGSTPRMLTTGTGSYASFASGFSDFTSGITIHATVDFGSVDTWERIIDFASDYNGGSFNPGDGDNSNNILFSRMGDTNDVGIQFYGARGVGFLGECKAASGIISGLHSYAVTVVPNGSSTTCIIYRDGVALSTTNTLSRMPDNVTRTANFAAHSNWTADRDLAGKSKSLFIYNRALSSAEIASTYTADQTPLAPTSLLRTTVSQTSVGLSWTAPSSSGGSSIADYVVEYSTNNSTWSTFADGTSAATTATVTGLAAATNYYFRVSASNSTLTGPVSASIQQVTSSPYTATFDSQGGSAVSPISWTAGQSITLPTPTRAGYTFNGWSTSTDASRLVYQTTTPTRSAERIVYSAGYGKDGSDAAATLTSQGATFNRVRYRMEAKYNGTLRYADVSFDKWSGATIADLAVPDRVDTRTIQRNVSNLSVDSNWPGVANVASPVTTGTGKSGRLELWPWNYAPGTSGLSPAGNGSIYDSDDTSAGSAVYGSFQVHNLTDSQTVLAWNNHSVSNPDIGFGNYIAGGASAHSDWTFVSNTNFDLSSWKLQIYIGDLFAGGTSYIPPSNADFSLYAQWTANPLTVTYDSRGGSSITSGSTVTDGSIASSPGTPTRAGYTFNGWFAASSGGTAISFPWTHGKTANFTLYAQWTANSLIVTYDSRGGSSITSGSTVTDGSIASSPGTPTKGTDVFKGWYTATSGGSAISFPWTHGKTANFTLYAQWVTNQATLSVTNAPTTLAYQSTVTLGTSGGSGTGAVTFATTTSSVCSVVAGTGVVTMLVGTGTCSIAATKAGDDDFAAAYGSVNITAGLASQTALSVSGSSSGAFGSTVALSTSGGSTSGSITWSAGTSTACTVDSSGVVTVTSGTGTCAITATMAGNTNYGPVTSSSKSISVSTVAQATLTVTSTETDYGTPLTLTTSGGSGTGNVTWVKVSGTCGVSGATLSPGNAGSACVVRATKGSDSNYNAKSSADTTITVNRAGQTGFVVTSSSSFTTGNTLILTATGGQSSGSVTWALTSGSCTLSGSTLSSARGNVTCVVEATKASDSNYLSTSDSLTVRVNKITQNLTFRSFAPSPATVGNTYTVTVDSDAFLAPTITIANTSSNVCSVNAGVVSFTAVGTCTISASQAGNDVYASAAASQSVTVTNASPAPVSPADPGSASATTTTTPASALPAAATTTTVASGPAVAGKNIIATTTTSTTTTTTTIPADPSQPQLGADGKAPDLEAGEATAFIRGQSVSVKVEQVKDTMVLTLPNKVKVTIGRASPESKSVSVASDGVLRVYRKDFVDVVATGLVPGTTYTIFMFSQPIELGRGVVDANGRVVITVQVPQDVATSEHTLQVNGVGPGGEIVTTSIGISVLKKTSNTLVTVLVLSLAILIALLGGRPIYIGRRRRRNN